MHVSYVSIRIQDPILRSSGQAYNMRLQTAHCLPLATYHALLTTRYLLREYCSPRARPSYYLPLTSYYVLLTTYYLLLLTTYYVLLASRTTLLLLTTYLLLLTTYYY